MATIVLTPEAQEDIRALDGSARKAVLNGLKKLKDSPEQRGAPLGSRASGNLTGLRKLVVGNRQYRIVFRVEADNSIVVVWVVGSRVDAECYDLAVARLEMHAHRPELRDMLQGLLDTAFDDRGE
ncbi:type II toxin-antitoxin system RelE/ParE family toxin [Demequina sp. SYSU T00192]|uniref:Type II toxin-antitoxin system RelE/ParE family toxin n=1 Tax=Demequina litoralis TaxID=3051660 RepID=A0ABT8G5B9_9MICO|nr:type II toxin-antitoxin system RelE/ParE family toxin [Demequina sp. SYSU T00192]MDN4474340.1 type II toxin-antitoxin system RelE/ParE family toxin [Demequina sp. SYSU T00192]